MSVSDKAKRGSALDEVVTFTRFPDQYAKRQERLQLSPPSEEVNNVPRLKFELLSCFTEIQPDCASSHPI